MANNIVTTNTSTNVVTVKVPGPRGPHGPPGTITSNTGASITGLL